MPKSSQLIPSALPILGWSAFFGDQIGPQDGQLVPARISAVHRSKIRAVGAEGIVQPQLAQRTQIADLAVGDWILMDPETARIERRLDRLSLLQRRPEGTRPAQLIAANVDTLFIVTSCNDDFNPARLERYLALANEAGTLPVIVLTKIDQVDSILPYVAQAEALQQDLPVIGVNAKSPAAVIALKPWCGPGQTVALVGSSGVGKSTLLNTLVDDTTGVPQLTGAIRDADAKGRHTTTSRSLHPITGGGLVIDTPGMRTLHVSDATAGLEQVFGEITALTPNCKFRDCTHSHEPGCAVQAAVADGSVDPARLERWRKLSAENVANTPVLSGPKGNKSSSKPGQRR